MGKETNKWFSRDCRLPVLLSVADTITRATRRIYNSCRDKRERFDRIDRQQRERKRRGFINLWFGYLRRRVADSFEWKFEWWIVHLRIAWKIRSSLCFSFIGPANRGKRERFILPRELIFRASALSPRYVHHRSKM